MDTPHGSIVIAANRRRVLSLLLVCLAGAVASIGFFERATGWSTTWVVVVVMGPLAALLAYAFRPGAFRLTLSQHGLLIDALNPHRLAWADIEAFYLVRMRSTPTIAIRFAPGCRGLRSTRAMNALFTGREYSLPNHYSIPAEALCELLNACRQNGHAS